MSIDPHKDCCLKLLKTLVNNERKDYLFTVNQIIELVKDEDCTYKSRVKTSVRELIRFGYLYKEANKYKIRYGYLKKTFDLINKFKRIDLSIELLYEKLPKSEFLTRQQLNKIYIDYSIPDIDQIVLKLFQHGFVEKVGGSKRRGKYYVKKDLEDTIFFTNPVKEIVNLYGSDITFCYHTALEIHGLSRYGMSNEIYINKKISKILEQSNQFTIKTVKLPESDIGITKINYEKTEINVTDLERTIIDCIHKPKYAIGWENVLYAIKKVEHINERTLLDYLKKLKTPSLYAKVGYLLEQFKEKWHISTITIIELEQMKPRNPVRFFRNFPGSLNNDWNLYIPDNLLES